jgi:hypothetical protein
MQIFAAFLADCFATCNATHFFLSPAFTDGERRMQLKINKSANKQNVKKNSKQTSV